jgi:CRP/FNR family transcriptional regulator
MPSVKSSETSDIIGGRLAEMLGGAAATRLTASSRTVNAPAGGTIMMEGGRATELFSVQSGIVSVFKLMPDGRRQITGFLYPGDFLGTTFNMAPTYGYGAEAVTAVSLRAYARRDFERLLDEVPGVRRAFIAKMADELTEAQDRMVLLGHSSASERMASFLLAMARRQAGAEELPVTTVAIPMRWSDIADYMGLTAETVSRTLAVFRNRGIVRTAKPGEISILDAAALKALAGPLAPRR